MVTSYEKGLYFSSKARRALRSAIYYQSVFRYPECITFIQDSIEFSGKAILEFLDIEYNKQHYIGRELEKVRNKIDKLKKDGVLKNERDFKNKIARAIVISDRWLQQSRNLTKYGFMDLGLSPITAFKKEEADLAINDCKELIEFLNNTEIYRKFQKPIKIAILNGYALSESEANPCNNPPSILKIDDWVKHLSNLKNENEEEKYDITKIKSCDINKEFALVINPFSETYPEVNVNKRLTFDIIEDYIFNGGIFLCTNGYPLFYERDVTQGKNIPLVDTVIPVPQKIVFKNTTYISKIKSIIPFSGTVVSRRLNCDNTGDNPRHQGPYSLKVFQRKKDIQNFGMLSNFGGSKNVDEFRAITDKTKNVIPILRANRPYYGEVYPIAAKKHGDGYLFSCGMKVKSSSDKNKIFKATDKFLSWISKNNYL